MNYTNKILKVLTIIAVKVTSKSVFPGGKSTYTVLAHFRKPYRRVSQWQIGYTCGFTRNWHFIKPHLKTILTSPNLTAIALQCCFWIKNKQTIFSLVNCFSQFSWLWSVRLMVSSFNYVTTKFITFFQEKQHIKMLCSVTIHSRPHKNNARSNWPLYEHILHIQ